MRIALHLTEIVRRWKRVRVHMNWRTFVAALVPLAILTQICTHTWFTWSQVSFTDQFQVPNLLDDIRWGVLACTLVSATCLLLRPFKRRVFIIATLFAVGLCLLTFGVPYFLPSIVSATLGLESIVPDPTVTPLFAATTALVMLVLGMRATETRLSQAPFVQWLAPRYPIVQQLVTRISLSEALVAIGATVGSLLAIVLPMSALVNSVTFDANYTRTVAPLGTAMYLDGGPDSVVDLNDLITKDYRLGVSTVVLSLTALRPVEQTISLHIELYLAVKLPPGHGATQGSGTLSIQGCSRPPCTPDGFLRVPDDFQPAHSTWEGALATDVTVETNGEAKNFPSDSYQFQHSATELLYGTTAQGPTFIPQQAFAYIAPQGLSDFQLVSVWAPHVVGMEVRRSTAVATYTYLVAFLPVVFALVIGQLVLSHMPQRPVDLATIYTGIAAASLTVLPLRATLIPTDIQALSLTRVDLALATEVGIFAGIAALAHARLVLWKLRVGRATNEAPPQTNEV
jgi:hypothetical protein